MSNTPVTSILLVFVASIIGSVGAVFLKLGAARMRYGLLHAINPQMGAGIALFLGSSVVYLLGIRRGEISVLFPMVSLSYVLGLFWSRWFFDEAFSKTKFIGLGLILIGVIFVGLGKA